jgi:Asp-tRNA(Asn)/Glu-tRNA(Gln) amidotransferase A subunit family amidase
MADAFPDYDKHDALGLAALVRQREATPAELLEAAIARIERANPRVNAVIDTLYERARAAIARGLPQGPFTGVPFLLKDLGQMLTGVRLRSGSRLFADYVAPKDSTLARRFEAAGLVVAGKTSTPELGCSITTEPLACGPSRNPWDTARTPGGSSGGAAAAVAAGMVPMAHASDGGGSIRAPAAWCGLYGMKPSRGRNPAGPDMGESLNGFSSNHCVSWTVRDSAALLDATSGPEPGDPYHIAAPERPFLEEAARDPKRLRIAASTQAPDGGPVDAEWKAATEAAAKLLADLGHHVEEAAPDYDADALVTAWRIIVGAVLSVQVASYAEAKGIKDPLALLEPANAAWVEEGKRRTAGDYFRAEIVQHGVGRRLGAFFARYDILLTPAMAGPPPALGTLAGHTGNLDDFYRRMFAATPFTAVFNATGGPSASIPFGFGAGGLPIGVQIGADLGRDGLVFALSGQIERARPWAGRRPPAHG